LLSSAFSSKHAPSFRISILLPSFSQWNQSCFPLLPFFCREISPCVCPRKLFPHPRRQVDLKNRDPYPMNVVPSFNPGTKSRIETSLLPIPPVLLLVFVLFLVFVFFTIVPIAQYSLPEGLLMISLFQRCGFGLYFLDCDLQRLSFCQKFPAVIASAFFYRVPLIQALLASALRRRRIFVRGVYALNRMRVKSIAPHFFAPCPRQTQAPLDALFPRSFPQPGDPASRAGTFSPPTSQAISA